MPTPEEIRSRAFEARISINRLLADANVAAQTIWRWERKVKTPRQSTIDKVMAALVAAEAKESERCTTR